MLAAARPPAEQSADSVLWQDRSTRGNIWPDLKPPPALACAWPDHPGLRELERQSFAAPSRDTSGDLNEGEAGRSAKRGAVLPFHSQVNELRKVEVQPHAQLSSRVDRFHGFRVKPVRCELSATRKVELRFAVF
jgi:hypothetical protein